MKGFFVTEMLIEDWDVFYNFPRQNERTLLWSRITLPHCTKRKMAAFIHITNSSNVRI